MEDGIYFYRERPGNWWRFTEIVGGKVRAPWIAGGGGDQTPEAHAGQWTRKYAPEEPEVARALQDSHGCLRDWPRELEPASLPQPVPSAPDLRDTFAAAALTGMLANPNCGRDYEGNARVFPEDAARAAYTYADWMMEARKS